MTSGCGRQQALFRSEIDVGTKRVVVTMGAVLAVAVLAVASSCAPLSPAPAASSPTMSSPTVGPPSSLSERTPAATPTASELQGPTTLAEAWELLHACAQRWQPGAQVGFLCSVDDAQDASSSGLDGRRRAWDAVLTGPTSSEARLSVKLVDGSIVEKGALPAEPGQPAPTGAVALDSPDALTAALEARPDFAPALPGGKGVHFCLELSDTGVAATTIRGSHGSQPAIVSVDATTGTVLAAQHQTLGLVGILYSSDRGQTWRGTEFPGVPAVTADPLVENKAYAATTQEGVIAVYQTEDVGGTWRPLATLPPAAGDWPFAMEAVATTSPETQLLVGTWSGLWSSADGGQWSLVPGLPEGPRQWLAAAQSETGYRLFVTVTAGEHPGLYARVDLANWEKVAGVAYRLSESFDHSTVLATNEQQADQALILSVDRQRSIEMAVPVLRAAGDFTGSAPALVYSPALGVGRGLSEAEGWTLFAAVGSMAAAPDFPTSQVVVAGGFRTGIYRTTDAGQTWQQVVANPSAIVPGNGEISSVEFLSATTVLAVNGGGLTWEDF
jgi:photosystem II stability/assembly factor-like uncharacterized protein